jgi:hypothetical protein
MGEMGRRVVWALATGGYIRLQYDPVMSDVFSAELGTRRLDGFLGAESRTHVLQNYREMTAFEPLAADLASGAGQSSDREILLREFYRGILLREQAYLVGNVLVNTLLAKCGCTAAPACRPGLARGGGSTAEGGRFCGRTRCRK